MQTTCTRTNTATFSTICSRQTPKKEHINTVGSIEPGHKRVPKYTLNAPVLHHCAIPPLRLLYPSSHAPTSFLFSHQSAILTWDKRTRHTKKRSKRKEESNTRIALSKQQSLIKILIYQKKQNRTERLASHNHHLVIYITKPSLATIQTQKRHKNPKSDNKS